MNLKDTKLKKYIYIICFSFMSLSVFAQPAFIKKYMEKRAIIKQNKIDSGKVFVSPIFGPGYTPENGLLIGGGALITFKTNRNDSLIQRSSLPLTAFFSTKGNIGLNIKMASFWKEDKIRFNVMGRIAKANDDYFGVGFETADAIEKGETTSEYDKVSFFFTPEFQHRIVKNLYAGVLIDVNQTNVKEANEIMLNDPNYLEYGNNNFNTGVGLTFTYDSRDITVNAYTGMVAKLYATTYTNNLGGDNNYDVYEIDLRKYFQINRPGNTFAVRLDGRFATGDVPYSEMSVLGGNDALRGYLTGKYRDRVAVFLIQEWRYMFLKSDGKMSKHGVVAWAGLGTMADTVKEINKFVPNGGVGYRFEVQPRMNVRIDFGVGRESHGLYFNFTEAF
jgi:hypothetical protein